jgi:hypothetical protein
VFEALEAFRDSISDGKPTETIFPKGDLLWLEWIHAHSLFGDVWPLGDVRVPTDAAVGALEAVVVGGHCGTCGLVSPLPNRRALYILYPMQYSRNDQRLMKL